MLGIILFLISVCSFWVIGDFYESNFSMILEWVKYLHIDMLFSEVDSDLIDDNLKNNIGNLINGISDNVKSIVNNFNYDNRKEFSELISRINERGGDITIDDIDAIVNIKGVDVNEAIKIIKNNLNNDEF